MLLFDLLYALILIVLSPLLLIRWVTDPHFRFYLRSRFLVKFDPKIKQNNKRRVWLHAASVGEVSLAIKIRQHFEINSDQIEFIITTNTVSAMKMAIKRGIKNVFLAPLDFSWVVRRFIKKLDIKDLILIETELWPNMVSLIKQTGSISVVNGRLSDKHFKTYRRLRFLFKPTLRKTSLILAGDPISKERFKKLGASSGKVSFVGNLKFEIPAHPKADVIEKVTSDYFIEPRDWVFVMGSIQPSEVDPLMKGVLKAQQKIGKLRLFMVPRHSNKKEEFKAELNKLGIPFHFSSDGPYKKEYKEEGRVIVIDEVGVLLAFYKVANLIFVGGSLCDRGGQNMLEAVALKKPVFIGPFATNFHQEVNILNQGKGIRIIKSSGEISEFLIKCLSNKKLAASYADNGFNTLVKNSGGFKRTTGALEALLRNRHTPNT